MKNYKQIIYWAVALICLFDFVSSPIALALGIVVANLLTIDSPVFAKKLSKYLLQASVVGLGFGMSLEQAFKAGSEGFVFASLFNHCHNVDWLVYWAPNESISQFRIFDFLGYSNLRRKCNSCGGTGNQSQSRGYCCVVRRCFSYLIRLLCSCSRFWAIYLD